MTDQDKTYAIACLNHLTAVAVEGLELKAKELGLSEWARAEIGTEITNVREKAAIVVKILNGEPMPIDRQRTLAGKEPPVPTPIASDTPRRPIPPPGRRSERPSKSKKDSGAEARLCGGHWLCRIVAAFEAVMGQYRAGYSRTTEECQILFDEASRLTAKLVAVVKSPKKLGRR